MNEDLYVAKKVLENHTCAISYNGLVFTSDKDVLTSINEFIQSGVDFSNFALATVMIDENVAKGIIDLKIKYVYSNKINLEAKTMLLDNNINISYLEIMA